MFSKQTSHQLQFVAPTHLKLTCMQSNALSLSRKNALICFIWQLKKTPTPPTPQFNRSCCLLLSDSLEDNLSWLLQLYSIRFHSIHELKSLIRLQPTHPQLSCIQTLKKSKCSSDEAATSHHSSSSRCPSAKQTETGCPAVPLDE